MKVLIIKTSSMGDVIHSLPALTDAGRALDSITFDWVVEKPFAEIPSWHPLVNKVVPVQIRKWRKHFLKAIGDGEIRNFMKNLRLLEYDKVIDAQGLMKSAFITRLAKGERCGLDWQSAWEPAGNVFYQTKFKVNPELHAITRVRTLFSKVLGYDFPVDKVEYGVDRNRFIERRDEEPFVLFLHGTTWVTKHWPVQYWVELAKAVNAAGFTVKLPWGNDIEKARAERIASAAEHAVVLPRLNLAGVACVIAASQAVISVDTGLGHLTAALNVPAVSLYGPTDPSEIGTVGASQVRLQSERSCEVACSEQKCVAKANVLPACFETLNVRRVMDALTPLLKL